MNNTEIVEKLIGPIRPVGETNADNASFENLKAMCELVDNLLTKIDAVAYDNRDSREFSVKRSADHASDFMTKIGIKE